MLDNNKIVNALRKVIDPNTGQDLIKLGILSEFIVGENQVGFTMDATGFTPQLRMELNHACHEAILSEYPNAQINLHMKSSQTHASHKRNPLPMVKQVIAVASGKGGVGKSTISLNLALSLKRSGYKVGLLDADLYGPSIPNMLHMQGQKPKVKDVYGKHKLVPIENNGLFVMSIGFIIEPEQAVVLRGPRLGGVIKQFIEECLWPELDFLIIDLPPGTGDIQLTLVQTIPVTGAVMVTTPQKIAVIDAVKAMNMFLLDNINVPIIGIVENMSWFTPAELPNNKYLIFGEGGAKELAKLSNSEVLGQIPMIQAIRERGDKGNIGDELVNDNIDRIFDDVANSFLKQLDIRNMTQPNTQIVEVKR